MEEEFILQVLEEAAALWEDNHALSRFDWGRSGLRAEDIRELNELPGKIHRAIAVARELAARRRRETEAGGA
jgi:hypothetical protein